MEKKETVEEADPKNETIYEGLQWVGLKNKWVKFFFKNGPRVKMAVHNNAWIMMDRNETEFLLNK